MDVVTPQGLGLMSVTQQKDAVVKDICTHKVT